MDSKVCSLGRDEALVSTPWARALPWIITPLSGTGCVNGCVCMCARFSGCDRMSEWGVTDTQKKLLILMPFFNIGGLSIFDKSQSLLPPTVTTDLKYNRIFFIHKQFYSLITLKMTNEHYAGVKFLFLS